MSTEHDTRVVELQFDNKQFEADVSKTLTSLDKLNAALKFEGAEKGFKDIEKAAGKLDLSGIEKAVSGIEDRFYSLGSNIKAKTIDQLGDAVVNFGKKTIKNLTIDQVTAGWSKYEQQVGAVQTILNSTGESMEEVSKWLEKLSWYTDETSYYFDDMVNNISKFTSQGIKIGDATDQMIGIANAAGLAGVNAQNAGHAMEGFAKAVSKGYMDRQNWTWIQTAKMETPKLKQLFIEVAEEMGKLNRVSEDTWENMEGHEVSVGNFLENLKDKWLDTEVMQEALRRYSSYTSRVYEVLGVLEEFSDKSYTTAQVMEALAQGVDASSEFVDDLTVAVERYNAATGESLSVTDLLAQSWSDLGEMGMRASQETKTFGDLVGAIQEVVSSGWRRTFDLVIGNYEEARDMWSQFAEDIWDVFALPAEARNEMLQEWREWGGREDLIEGVRNLYFAVMSYVTPIQEAFREIFPSKTGQDLANITYNFRLLTEAMILNEEAADGLHGIFKAMFAILKPFVTILKTDAIVVWNLTKAFFKLIDILLQNVGGLEGLNKALTDTGRYGEMVRGIVIALTLAFIALKAPALIVGSAIAVIAAALYSLGAFSWVSDKVSYLASLLGSFLLPILQSISSWLSSHLPTIEQMNAALDKLASGVAWVHAKTAGFSAFLATMWGNHIKNIKTVKDLISVIWNALKVAFDKVTGFFKNSDFIQKFVSTFTNGVSAMHMVLPKLTADFTAFANSVSAGQVMLLVFAAAILILITNVNKLVKKLTTVAGALTSAKDIFSGLNKYINALVASTKYSGLINLGIALAIISGSLVALSYADWDNMWKGVIVLGAFAAAAVLFNKYAADISRMAVSFKEAANIGLVLMGFAVSIAALANAIGTLVQIDWKKFKENWYFIIGAFAASVGTMMLFIGFINALTKSAGDLGALGLSAGMILSFAASVYILAQAMKDLSGLPDLMEVAGGIIAVSFALGLMVAGLAQINGLRGGFGALMAVLALKIFVASLEDALPPLLKIQAWLLSLKPGEWLTVFGSLAVLGGFVWVTGQVLLGAGTGLLAGVLALLVAVKAFANADIRDLQMGMYVMNQLSNIVIKMAAFMAVIGVLIRYLSRFGGESGKLANLFKSDNPFKGMSGVFISMGVAMIALSAALKITSGIPRDDLDHASDVFAGLTFMFALALAAAGYGREGAKAIKQLTTAMLSMAALVAIMSFFTVDGISQLTEPALILGGLLLSFCVSMALAGNAAGKIKMGPLIAMVVGAGVIAAGLIGILGTGAEWNAILAAGVGFAAALWAVGKGIQMAAENTPKRLENVLPALLLMALDAAIIGGALYAIASVGDWKAIGAAGAGFAAALWALGKGIALVADSAPPQRLKSVMPALLAMAVDALAIGAALMMIGSIGDPGVIFVAALGLSGSMLALGQGMWLAGKEALKALQGIPALLVMAVDAVAIGASLALIGTIGNWQEIAAAAGAFVVCILALSGGIALAGLNPAAIGATGPLLAMALDAIAIAIALNMIALIGNWDAIWPAMAGFSGAILALSLGVGLAGLNPAAIGATVPLLAMAVDAVAIGLALNMIANIGDWEQIKAALNGFAAGIAILVAAVEVLGFSSVIATAGATVLLIIAAALAAFVAETVIFVAQVDKFANAIVLIGDSLDDITKKAPQAAAALKLAIADMGNTVTVANQVLLPQIQMTWRMIGAWMPISVMHGINDTKPQLVAASRLLAYETEEAFRDQVGIHSLSTILAAIGGWFSKSIGFGITDSSSEAEGAAQSLGQKIISKIASFFGIAYDSGKTMGENFAAGLESVVGDIQIGGFSGSELASYLLPNGLTGSASKNLWANAKYKIQDNGEYWISDDQKNWKQIKHDGEKWVYVNGEVEDSFDSLVESMTAGMEDIVGGYGDMTGAAGANTKASATDAKQAAETAKKYAYYSDVMNYAKKSVDAHISAIKARDETMSNTEAEDLAIKKTEDMILAHYKDIEALDEEVQAVTTFAELTKEQLIAAGEAWEEYYGGIRSKFEQTFDYFSDPFDGIEKWSMDDFTSFDSIFKNFNNNAELMKQTASDIGNLVAMNLDPEIIADLWEKFDWKQIYGFAHMDEGQIALINEQYYAYKQAMEEAATSVANAMTELGKKEAEEIAKASHYAAVEYLTGESLPALEQTAKDLINQISNAADPEAEARGLGAGQYWDEGIAKGITSNIELATYAVGKLMDRMIAEIERKYQEALARIVSQLSIVASGGASGSGSRSYSSGSSPSLSFVNQDLVDVRKAAEQLNGTLEQGVDALVQSGKWTQADVDRFNESTNHAYDSASKTSGSVTEQKAETKALSAQISALGDAVVALADSNSGVKSVGVTQNIYSPSPISTRTADATEKSAASNIAKALK